MIHQSVLQQSDKFQDLKQALIDEVRLNQQLMKVAEKKRQSLVNVEYEKLESNIQEEQQLMVLLSSVSSHRIKLTQSMALEFGIANSDVSLTKIAGMMPMQNQTAIIKLVSALKQVINRTRRVNLTNKTLLESALGISGGFIQTLTAMMGEQNTYTKRGTGKIRPTFQMVINQVV